MPEIGKAGPGHQTHIARANHCNTHETKPANISQAARVLEHFSFCNETRYEDLFDLVPRQSMVACLKPNRPRDGGPGCDCGLARPHSILE
jgi:hypothetical protein